MVGYRGRKRFTMDCHLESHPRRTGFQPALICSIGCVTLLYCRSVLPVQRTVCRVPASVKCTEGPCRSCALHGCHMDALWSHNLTGKVLGSAPILSSILFPDIQFLFCLSSFSCACPFCVCFTSCDSSSPPDGNVRRCLEEGGSTGVASVLRANPCTQASPLTDARFHLCTWLPACFLSCCFSFFLSFSSCPLLPSGCRCAPPVACVGGCLVLEVIVGPGVTGEKG